ncbi:MAG: class I SAM-dependent methyltransferase [Planctomycetes bacterium]|nr:class I SAM-dependent methyltransferase [Planctomycetota bacterium]
MPSAELERWNAKYALLTTPDAISPDVWLTSQLAHVPPGRALEFACGLGHNAIWLAQQGWQVDAVDISPTGLQHAAELAGRVGASVQWIAADLMDSNPAPASYDLALVFRFLDRDRLPGLIESALRTGGLLYYETFTVAHLQRPASRMKNPDFALQPGELPRLFPHCEPVSYAECSLSDRDVARLEARRLPR